MTDAEFEAYLQSANDELHQKQRALESDYGLGHAARWWFDQALERLQFFNEENRMITEAEVIPIGSYSPKSSTWKWAWANESILPFLRSKTHRLTELEALTGLPMFASAHAFKIEEEAIAWELTAMSVRFLNAVGSYRTPAPSDGPRTFLAVMNIRRCGLQ